MTSRARWAVGVAALALVAPLLIGGQGAAAPADQPRGSGERGTWQVRALGSGQYAVAWTSPTRLPMGSDRPAVVGPESAVVGVTTVAGRTVRATVSAATPPTADQLDVVLSGRSLDEVEPGPVARAAPAPSGPLDLAGTVTLGHDPATRGPFRTVSSDYRLAPLPLRGLATPVEMIGHVVEPEPGAATGQRPLVVFLHGRHNVCYQPGDDDAWTADWPCRAPFLEVPSHLGYDYLQQVLASQGYATVSLSVNGINAQDGVLTDGGASARAAVVAAHLDYWASAAAQRDADLSRVVLVGHSRGGEGVARASIRIPLTAPYRVVGEVLIAPTDFGWQTSPYVPSVTLLPFCDGDVADLQGQRFTDVGRDLTSDDTALRSSVLVMGANHNYFNTTWTPRAGGAPASDDWSGPGRQECGRKHPDRLSAAEQRAVATAYVAGAVQLFASSDERALPLFDGSRARVASQGRAQALSHAIGGGRSVRSPRLSAHRALPQGARTRLCLGTANPDQMRACGYGVPGARATPHWPVAGERVPARSFLEMTWTAAGQAGGLLFAHPLDLRDRRLEVRAIVDPRASAKFQVRLTDADGRAVLLTPVGGGALPALGRQVDVRKLWAQALVVDPAGAAVDLARVTRVDLVALTGRGRVWVADVASAPATLAAVPERRLPTVSVGRVRVDEGDRGNPVVELPFRVTGTITEPAQVVFVTVGQRPGDVHRLVVDLAPGETRGSVPVRHEADRRADYRRLVTQVAGWATRNVMTDVYHGDVTVIDDDPRPRLRVRTDRRRVVEGQPASWTVSLSRAADYDVPVSLVVVRSPRPALRVGDVSPRWIETHVGSVEPDQPLWRVGAMTFGVLRPGSRVLRMAIPTRRDGVAEGPETLRVRMEVGRRTLVRNVTVVDAP